MGFFDVFVGKDECCALLLCSLLYTLVNSHSFLSFDQIPTFYSLYFQCHEIPENSVNVKFSTHVTFSEMSLFFSSPLLSSYVSVSLLLKVNITLFIVIF